MANYIQLPNGSYYQAAEGQSYLDAIRDARKYYPDAFGVVAQTTPPETGFIPSIKRGFAQTGMLLGDVLPAMAARAVGADEYANRQLAEAAATQKEIQEKYPAAVPSFTDIKSPGDAFRYITEAIGESIPSLIPALFTGGAAAVLARPATAAAMEAAKQTAAQQVAQAAAKGALSAEAIEAIKQAALAQGTKAAQNIALKYQAAGAITGSAAQNVPEVYQNILEETGKEELGAALVGGGFNAVLDAITPINLLRKARAAGIPSQEIVGAWYKRAGRGVAEGFLTEGATEAVQEMSSAAAVKFVDENKDFFTKENFVKFLYAGLRGGIGGGAVTGAANVAFGTKESPSALAAQQQAAQQAAAAEEAARNQPAALNQLYDQYQALNQQKAQLDEQVDALRPKKGSTAEEKQAFQNAKTQRDEFVKTQFKPVELEYNKRKGAIDQMFAQRQADLEAQAAATQPAAKLIAPSDLPGAQPFQLAPVPRLMGTYGDLRTQLNNIQTQLAAGPDTATHAALETQRQQLAAQMGELAPIIEARGGTTDTLEELDKKIKAVEKERIKFLEQGDFDAAAQQIEKLKALQLKLPMLEEARLTREQAGQTRELFKAEPPQPQAQGIKYVSPAGAPLSTVAEKPEDAAVVPVDVIPPKQLENVDSAKTAVRQAEQALANAAASKNTEVIYKAVDTLNQAEYALARARESVGRPALKPVVLDIFDPHNVMQEALRRGDRKLLNDLARQVNSTTLRQSLDEKASERNRLMNVVQGRLDAEGTKRERADLFSQIYDAQQQARFKNGTYPDKELQEMYDRGGAELVENAWVADQIKPLMAKVTTPQGNAKKSLYQMLVETAAEHARLTEQMESGVATPTMGEKVAGVQAKLGKGEAPAERMMDAAERYQLQRKIDGLLNKYRMIEGKITPIRDQILAIQNSLYKTTPLKKPSVERAEKQAASTEAAKGRKAKSRTAATAARIAKGDVRKEAEASQKLRDLALELGMREPAYAKLEKDATKRMTALEERYGDDDPQVRAYRKQVAEELPEKARALGRQTPEYKATLKEQIAYFQEVLPTAGKQEVPTKRTTQVTRKQTAAPKRMVTSSAESKAATAREQQAYTKYRGSLKDMQEALEAEKQGREDERFARGVEVESPNLTPTQVQALEENDLTAALADIANNKKNTPLNRAVAQRLSVLLDATDVQLDDKLVFDGEEVLGAATSKLVQLSRDGGLSQEVLLHEGTHAAAERVIVQYEKDPSKLTEQQRVAVRELKAIFEAVKKDPRITSVNAKSSLSEFVAEVMSNSKLQEQLREKPWRMSDMLRAVKSVILRMVGIKPSEVETMLGASITAVDALFIPSSTRLGTTEQRVTRQLSAKDIAALHDGSNSMQQFADQFGPLIKQADRTPQDVERIAEGFISDMKKQPKEYVPFVDADRLDYVSSTIMSDGKPFDTDNPLHYVEATPATFAALKASEDSQLRAREAKEINKQRLDDFKSLVSYLQRNPSYTLAEQALVLKAASQYAVVSDKSGRLKLAALADNNRHGIAVVGHDAADAVIRELRAGKSLKKAFLEGLQANADASAKVNGRKNGWQKFDQAVANDDAKPKAADYTDEEIDAALDQTGYEGYEFGGDDALVQRLVEEGFLPYRGPVGGGVGAVKLEEAAIALNAGAANTPWCTGASVSTARSQIEQGDFYIYYKDGKPEVAVRMNGHDEIGEVRGNSPNQALTFEQQQIAAAFLRDSQFKDSQKYLAEFSKRAKLIAVAKDEAAIELADLLSLRRPPIKDDGSIDALRVREFLSFRTVDGYGGRPEPSAKVVEFFGTELKDAIFHLYAENAFIYSDISVKGAGLTDYRGRAIPVDKKIEVEFGGQTFEATNDTLRGAKSILFAGYAGRDYVLPKLAYVQEISTHSSADRPVNVTLPAAKFVGSIKTFAEEKDAAVVTLPSDARVDALAGYSQADTYIELRGPRHINAIFVQGLGGDVRLLHAYLPDTKYFTLQRLPKTGSGTITAPKFIAKTPPVDTLTEVPETPRFAPKDVGAVEEKPGVFGFKRQRAQTSSVVGREPGFIDTFFGNFFGLAGRVQYVDRWGALRAAIKEGMSAGQIDSLEATNAEYLINFGQQTSQYAQQTLVNGPTRLELTKKDGFTQSLFRSTKGVNMLDVAETLNAAKIAAPAELENMFTVYLAGERAKQVGWEKLNFENPGKAKAEYDGIIAQLNADKQAKEVFEKAKKLYQQYNANQLDLLVQTGVMTPQKAAELKSINYVPYYRVSKNGEVQLMVDKETPVRISNIKDEPQLQSLVGGNEYILPIFTSAVQNTYMLTHMALRNQTVKEMAFLLQKLGIASRLSEGAGPAGPDVVRFKKNGKDYHVVIDTDLYGIPADLIIKGMEGIKTTMPGIVRLMGYPADILRTFVTRMPTYAIRQMIRDPLNAWMTTGTDAMPVLSSMKELATMMAGRNETQRKLMETGAISSNVFSGDERDMAKFIKDISAGKSLWAKTLAKADALAMQADAATRVVVYKDSLAKGMSEQEALNRTLESMNFGRRGVSPSMHWLSVMIPFFNAQIQGLDVIYRAYKGDMPYSEQLKIKEKLMARGAMMAMGTLAYAALMSDDEAYKRAKPEERFANWFVYIPGVSEPVRVPIPFELGFLFKALPEAVYGLAFNDEKAGKTLKGLGKLVDQSNPFSLPQAIKPLTEVVLGRSFFQGDIESAREKEQMTADRYRANTTEVAKLLGQVTGKVGVSPIEIDYLIRGYFGGLGIAITQLANPILTIDQKEAAQPSTKPSKLPFIGGLFQPVEGRGTLDEAYDRMQEIKQVKGTYNKLIEDGKRAEAQAFVQRYTNDLAQASVSGRVQKQLGELAKQERIIKAHPTMPTEEKDRRLEQLDKIKVQLARQFLAVAR